MNLEQSEILHREVTKLNPSPVIELFELDVRPCDVDSVLYFKTLPLQEALRFHNGTASSELDYVRFDGNTYQPLPIKVKGFEFSGSGTQPRPTLSIMNVGGFMSSLIIQTKDLVGAKLTRRRTFARFLDGQPEGSGVQYPPDVFVVVQKTREDRLVVEFELGSGLDLDGVRYPRRTITSSYCQHVFRGAGCRFAGTYVVMDKDGIAFEGMRSFRGTWNDQATYSNGQTVWFDQTKSVYICTAASSVSGSANYPLNTTHWRRVQQFRGEYSSTTADYVAQDVVFRSTQLGRIYYIAITPTVAAGVTPPNPIFWKVGECPRNLTACRTHFDPFSQGRTPLPMGAFPGTLTIPEV